MIHIKDHKQTDIFDPWSYMSPKRRDMLGRSWVGLFKEHLLCDLPVNKLAPFFDDAFGRPTKELHTVLGVLILQRSFDFTDEEAVNQLAFNIQWHYALNIPEESDAAIPEESDAAKYICPKTLWNMRSIIVDNNLDAILFETITDKLALVFKVDTSR